uniref:Ig-like domain-containing protein n=1 Tax=Maylandia zebra TaxID=106582 RepID=A0A3P9DTW0_9CICH
EHQTTHRLTAGDSVTPQRDKVTETEGESVTLTCKYQTSESDVWLNWYRHDSDLQAPQFILYKGARSQNEFKERFSSTLDSSIRSAPLKIQKLQLSDSAVYYCALQPTVTGNSKTLCFAVHKDSKQVSLWLHPLMQNSANEMVSSCRTTA